jgi:hypothetical protein
MAEPLMLFPGSVARWLAVVDYDVLQVMQLPGLICGRAYQDYAGTGPQNVERRQGSQIRWHGPNSLGD